MTAIIGVSGEEVKDYFEVLVSDSMDETATFLLMQNEQEKLEMERDWMVLRKKDTSLSVTPSDTYTTARNLPTDFISPRKVVVNGLPLTEINADDQEEYKNISGYYFIDYSDMTLHLTGVYGETATIYLFYKKTLGTVDAETIFPWFGKTGLVIAYRMAQHHKGGIDGDEVNFQMTPEQNRQYKEMLNSMIQWDTKLQLKAMGN